MMHERRWNDARVWRALTVVQIGTSLLAVAAVIVWLTHLGHVQTSRRRGAVISCRAIKGLSLAATTGDPIQRVAVTAYLASSPLYSCHVYSLLITR